MYFTLDDKRRVCLVTGDFDEFGEPRETTRTITVQEACMLRLQLDIVIEEAARASGLRSVER